MKRVIELKHIGPKEHVRTLIEDLIDRRLIRAFLTQKGVKVPDDLIELQWTKLEEAAAAGKLDLAKVLSRLGYTEKALKDDLRLPLAWTSYVKKQTTDDQVRKFFGDHKNHFDGTTRHVRHLVVIVPEGAPVDAWSKAEARLNELRGEITAGKISFADAAKANSDSPTKESGGDLGFVHFHGDLAPPVAEAAFATKLKNVSEPVRSPFGVHLVMVEEERAGDISLEDARADVLEAIAQSMWAQQTQELRKKAKITRPAGR